MTVGDTIELAFLYDSPEEVDALHAKVVAAGYQSFKEPWVLGNAMPLSKT